MQVTEQVKDNEVLETVENIRTLENIIYNFFTEDEELILQCINRINQVEDVPEDLVEIFKDKEQYDKNCASEYCLSLFNKQINTYIDIVEIAWIESFRDAVIEYYEMIIDLYNKRKFYNEFESYLEESGYWD